ncbi:Pyrimidine-specific ribonucleoside hydrolase RihA [Thelohanellus kitauei]|uniref:Pyrimidine-specific ribonucleoside hydrolase RihA n=1 Tax=Thelohanellus kitauei TaxID=669202 RepID=A0A0C2INX6_THEKT|nr:Pyrimidine-specific ribonucleoside hydrolase RihA [Thelohanellus kitauei]
MSRKIIIDCDPGLDDARGILFLLSDPKINLLALTIVGGNAHAAVSSYNAGLVLEAMKRSDIPIFQGPSKNFSNEIIKSDYYFGKTGFGKLQLFSSTVQVRGDMEAYQALLEYGNYIRGKSH